MCNRDHLAKLLDLQLSKYSLTFIISYVPLRRDTIQYLSCTNFLGWLWCLLLKAVEKQRVITTFKIRGRAKEKSKLFLQSTEWKEVTTPIMWAGVKRCHFLLEAWHLLALTVRATANESVSNPWENMRKFTSRCLPPGKDSVLAQKLPSSIWISH